jgi:ComF family protein
MRLSDSHTLQRMLKPVLTGFEALLSLFYPRICGGCNAHLRKYEGDLCLICLYSLPKTYYWDYPITPIEELFKGRLKVSSACSFLHFEKMSVTQRLMHRLKYDGKTSIGVELGRAFGLILKEKKWYSDVDIIVPVPLHFTKLARRGYNQSTTIANGLAEVYNVRVRPHALKRMVNSETQTRKARYARTENVQDVFVVAEQKAINGKNVLLVDDVVTTGSTLEAAGQALLNAGAAKLYIATLATA